MTQVTIEAVGTALTITAGLDDVAPKVTGGARWRNEPRPKRKPLTIYEGQEPLTLTLGVLLDRWPAGDVEQEIAILEAMAAPLVSGGDPPEIRVTGPIPHSWATWVITATEWGDVRYSTPGRRARQHITLTLTEFVRADQVVVRTPPVPKAAAKTGRYTVRAGDTLETIAARKLGKASRWRELAKLNKLTDPRRPLRAGTTIRLPNT